MNRINKKCFRSLERGGIVSVGAGGLVWRDKLGIEEGGRGFR